MGFLNKLIWATVSATVLLNIKSFPFMYTLRFFPLVTKLSYRLTLKAKNEKRNVVQVNVLDVIAKKEVIQYHRVFFDDIDVNFHMNNSISIFSSVFGLDYTPYFPMINPKGGKKRIANAGVQIWFLKEIKSLQQYRVHSRILTWDDKWIYTLHRFYFTKSNQEVLAAYAIVKQVLKEKNGKTIPVLDAFVFAGHNCLDEHGQLNKEWEDYRLKGLSAAQGLITSEKALLNLSHEV